LVPVVKLQSAYFEIFGPEGIRAMQTAASEASSRGFLVIVDVKRGDIGETSAAYAEAYLGSNAFIECDAMTLNPYLGWDSLEPFFRVALEQSKGVFVCAQTSNPGARDLQSAVVGQKPVYRLVADHVSARDESSEPSLGLVVGATFPDTAAELRKLRARCWFLVPGIGAQGGSLDTIDRFFRPDGLGALLSSSRAVTFPHRFGTAKGWTEEAVRDAAQELVVAIRNREPLHK